MDATVQAAALAGLADEQVHVERFVSLPMEGAVAPPVTAATEPATPAAETSTAPQLDEAQLEIELNGEVHRIDCGAEETLLEAAQRHLLPAPYSCQAGLCAACMCRVVEGQVHMRHNDALDARDLKLGWVLGCQSVPRTAVVKVKYP
jgi:3-ketosteroid 9alpha-monooxygenase subunit B